MFFVLTQTFAGSVIEKYRDRLHHWSSLWQLPHLPDQVSIEFSNRLRSSIGICYPEQGIIRLHPVLNELDEHLALEILCHELAHVAVFRHYVRTVRPHGAEWRRLMRVAGFEPRARLPEEAIFRTQEQRATRRTVLWHHRCPHCDTHRTARRPVYQWRCATCYNSGQPGTLEIQREEVRG